MPDPKQDRFKDITIKVGNEVYSYKRFNGRLLAKGRFRAADARRFEVMEVYQTRRDAIALYVRDTPDWSAWNRRSRDPDATSPGRGSTDDWRGRYTFEVFETLELLRGRIPAELYHVAEQNLNHGPVEVLDI